MFFKEWNVLVVDDEPDVLAEIKLALRDVTVYGLPVKVHTAESKAQAIALLNGPLALPGSSEPIVAVAIVDATLNDDLSGLALCKYIRDEAGGHSVQLYLRAGPPEPVLERGVLDAYDVSGYFTRLELTEQKLYALVKGGVRQWLINWYVLMTESSIAHIVANSGSRREFLENGLGWFGEPGPQEGEAVTGFIFDGKTIVSDYPDYIKPLFKRLDILKPMIETTEGHKLTVDDAGNVLVRTVKTKSTADYVYVGESFMMMPSLLLEMTFKSGLVFSTLWKKITDAEKKAVKKKADEPVRSITKKSVKKRR